MKVSKVKSEAGLKKGNLIIIDDGDDIYAEQVMDIKITEQDGIEIIFNRRENKFFNLGMYLDGNSWVKDLMVVRRD